MNNIHQMLAEASWRMRAYFGSDDVDSGRVGWRGMPQFCPIAEWLDFEQLQVREWRMHLPSVDGDDLVYDGERLATPPLLARFIDLIDTATLASSDTWLRLDDRVSREEALAALAEAERLCSYWLLPARAQSLQCAYGWPGHTRCRESGVTPEIHGFLMCDPNPHRRPGRLDCWAFTGRLCTRHLAHLVIPPASWWPEEPPSAQATREREREAVLV